MPNRGELHMFAVNQPKQESGDLDLPVKDGPLLPVLKE